MITTTLLDAILSQYELPWQGIHGISHWARVLENGRRLARLTGAKLEVVELFAIFHDARRLNERRDDEHGRRGAELAARLRGAYFTLSDADFKLLETACIYHTAGLTEAEITIQTCWDADRLDLLRSGIRPAPRYLCTPAAKDPAMLSWANKRSGEYHVPALVQTEWGLELGW
ncbi:MAG TPA: hypothetical protein G4N98_10250 [Thermoflexia bacterium]|nr:hypothetical protein [Thermoflexia bacterium]